MSARLPRPTKGEGRGRTWVKKEDLVDAHVFAVELQKPQPGIVCERERYHWSSLFNVRFTYPLIEYIVVDQLRLDGVDVGRDESDVVHVWQGPFEVLQAAALQQLPLLGVQRLDEVDRHAKAVQPHTVVLERGSGDLHTRDDRAPPPEYWCFISNA